MAWLCVQSVSLPPTIRDMATGAIAPSHGYGCKRLRCIPPNVTWLRAQLFDLTSTRAYAHT
eukprot:564287-Lingulodinium_polyedra.AAC.1